MKSRFRSRWEAGFIFLTMGLILNGCAYNRVQLAGGTSLSIERVESSPIYISWVYAEEQSNEMSISGLLRSHYSPRKGAGHVDVAVIGPGGDLLGKASIDYSPKDISHRSGGSKFEAQFPFLPPEGSRIRVAFHNASGPGENPMDCSSNLAAEGGEV